MEIVGKLVKKEFTTPDGQVKEYYVLSIPLVGNEKMEITIKSDKAKLLIMSETIKNSK